MIVGGAAGDIAVEGAAEIGRGVMAAHRLARPAWWRRSRRPSVGSLAGDAGKVHHLAEPDDVGPGHRLGHVLGTERGAGMFEAGRGGHAGGHLHIDVDRHGQRLVVHQPHARQAQHVGDLVRVDEHGGRAVRDDGAGRTR